MPIIKCKMCGGDIEISADKTFGTCEYCGSTMTLPKTDDGQRLSLFNRGTHLRRNGEFDKAAAIYEQLIGENDADAEAHWNLLLCRYGIEYVQDPASGERIPTCHRASFDSILNDVDYQAALQYSDGVARSLYEKEAQRIAGLQKDILAISQKETPFDVFICYKESDENGRRTKDSALAQDIYYQLTDAGYKVFFARITLEDKLGQEYEPYIFAALHSAKVMVVVGTKPEYLNAVWVRNEWSRYLALMRTDRSRLLIPCYRDMDPYDMPEELSMLQCQDMGRIGFVQDLIRGVKKVIDTAKPQEAAREAVKETVVVHNEGSSNVQALLDRGQMALEDGEWAKADEFFEQVLNQDAKCGAAYLGKFLSGAQCRSAKDYADAFVEEVKDEAPGEKNADACDADEAFIASCIRKYAVDGILSGDEIRQMLEFDLSYCNAADYYALRTEEAQAQLAADKDLMRAEKYASREVKTITDGIQSALDKLRADAQKHEDAEKARLTAEYRKFLTEAEAKLEKEHPQRLEEAQAQQKAAAKARKITTIALGAAAAIITAVLLITKVIVPAANYSKAEKHLAAGDYDNAITTFTNLGDYKDAAEQLAQAKEQKENERLAREAAEEEARNAQAYADAVKLQESGEYDSAIDGFTELGDYKDAAEHLNACLYAKADQLAQNGDYQEAYLAFAALGAYQDAAERSRDAGAKYFQQLRENYPRSTISAGYEHTVALRNDGTCLVTAYVPGDEYDSDSGQCNVSDWTGLVSVSAGFMHTVGLKADGTVLATTVTESDFDYGQSDVSDWTDIVAVAAGTAHTLGLRKDGTVVSTTYRANDFINFNYGQCNVSNWTDIVAIDTTNACSVGLKSDGTVVIAGEPVSGGSDISGWENIIAIADGGTHIVGLRADGTVVAVGDNQYGECNVSDWADIVAIDAEYGFTIGLKSDGTVVSTGDNQYGQCNVSDWTDIVAVSASAFCTIGLRSDGTLVATEILNGDFLDHGQNKVSGWSNIKLPN